MRLENRTGVTLEVTTVTPKESYKNILKKGESAYFGDFKKNESLKIKSPKGTATIFMVEDELFWENTDEDFIKDETLQSDGLLQFEELSGHVTKRWYRHLNGIALRVTVKENP